MNFLNFFLLTIFVTFLNVSNSNAGGMHGGGGNVCFIGNESIILDLVHDFIPNLNSKPGVRIPDTLGELELYNPFQGPGGSELRIRVTALLQELKNHYPDLEKILQLGVQNLWFYATHEKFAGPFEADFQRTRICTPNNVRAVIGFYAGLKFISLPYWNQLDLDTQSHLIIHEGWRYFQFLMNSKAQQNSNSPQEMINNRHLQDLTYATVVNTGEISKLNIVSEYYKFLGLPDGFQRWACTITDSSRFEGFSSQIKNGFKNACSHPFVFNKAMFDTLRVNIHAYLDSKLAMIKSENRNMPRDEAEFFAGIFEDLSFYGGLLGATEINQSVAMFSMGMIDAFIRPPSNLSSKAYRQSLCKILYALPLAQPTNQNGFHQCR